MMQLRELKWEKCASDEKKNSKFKIKKKIKIKIKRRRRGENAPLAGDERRSQVLGLFCSFQFEQWGAAVSRGAEMGSGRKKTEVWMKMCSSLPPSLSFSLPLCVCVRV